ncbi:MAG: hypothetical protein Q7R95_06045 [bacterium]|nr:hypothetical protein [bacterium]
MARQEINNCNYRTSKDNTYLQELIGSLITIFKSKGYEKYPIYFKDNNGKFSRISVSFNVVPDFTEKELKEATNENWRNEVKKFPFGGGIYLQEVDNIK